MDLVNSEPDLWYCQPGLDPMLTRALYNPGVRHLQLLHGIPGELASWSSSDPGIAYCTTRRIQSRSGRGARLSSDIPAGLRFQGHWSDLWTALSSAALSFISLLNLYVLLLTLFNEKSYQPLAPVFVTWTLMITLLPPSDNLANYASGQCKGYNSHTPSPGVNPPWQLMF